MSPRPYQLGKRQAQIDDSRRKIIEAARALLAESTSYTAFTVDAVARRADVARATIYYQFQSKSGVLEALCDSLAETGQMSSLAHVFMTDDPDEALRGFISAFARFWGADRLVMRRLRALAQLDPEVRVVIDARDERNRQGLRVLLARMAQRPDVLPALDGEEAIKILHTLTSFETFDSLAGVDRSPADVVPIVVRLVETVLRRSPGD